MSDCPELIQLRFLIQPQYDGWRLDHYLKARIPRLSRNRIQKMIHSQPQFGGLPLRPSTRVRAQQELILLRPAPEEPEVPRTFSILYRDPYFLAINKPAGLPVHATARFHKNTLAALLREQFSPGPIPSLAHRLDRETSGLMLLGCNSSSGAALKKAFRLRQVQKRYLAIVHGHPPAEERIDWPLGPDTRSGIRIKMDVVADGLPARTRFKTLEHRGNFSLLEVFPETGRQHQIRIHLAARGFPIVGDKLYGQDPSVWLEFIELGWTEHLEHHLLLPRQALHAASVSFPHPHSGKILQLHCDFAEDLQSFWDNI